MSRESLFARLLDTGYTARSGNSVRFVMVADKPGSTRRTAVVAKWARKPSEADKAELEQILESGGIHTVRGIDLDAGAERVFSEMKDFFAKPPFI
jgi:hypothetical protein